MLFPALAREDHVCFSPQADVAGGVLIAVIGVDAVRHIHQRRDFIALAWIPVLLGARQFIEALVWLSLQGHVPRGIGQISLWAYLLIAFVVLPVFIPLAIIALEPTRRRKQMRSHLRAARGGGRRDAVGRDGPRPGQREAGPVPSLLSHRAI